MNILFKKKKDLLQLDDLPIPKAVELHNTGDFMTWSFSTDVFVPEHSPPFKFSSLLCSPP